MFLRGSRQWRTNNESKTMELVFDFTQNPMLLKPGYGNNAGKIEILKLPMSSFTDVAKRLTIEMIADLLIMTMTDVPNWLHRRGELDFGDVIGKFGSGVQGSVRLREIVRFWFDLQCRSWNNISRTEYGVDYTGQNYDLSPLLTAGMMPALEDELFDVTMAERVLLPFSGGKESTFIDRWLEDNLMGHERVGVFDTYQTMNNPDKKPLPHENIIFHEFQMTTTRVMKDAYTDTPDRLYLYGISTFYPVTVLHRLCFFITALARGDEWIVTGDELEDQQLLRLFPGAQFYAPHTWHQSNIYSRLTSRMVAEIGELMQLKQKTPKLFSPIVHIMQSHLLLWLAKHDVPLNSCWVYDNNEWCNGCGKCHRVAMMFKHFQSQGADLPLTAYPTLDIKGAEVFDLLSDAEMYSRLGQFDTDRYYEYFGGHVRPLFLQAWTLQADKRQASVNTDEWEFFTHPLVDAMTPASVNNLIAFVKRS